MLICVDFETTGLLPGRAAVVDIGAVAIRKRGAGPAHFRSLVLPFVGAEVSPEAMAIHKIPPIYIEWYGNPPGRALDTFCKWVRHVQGADEEKPIFVGWNAAFDWSLLRWYLGRYGLEEPFHYTPLDLKAYLAGWAGIGVREVGPEFVKETLGVEMSRAHSALQDARDCEAVVLAVEKHHGEGVFERKRGS